MTMTPLSDESIDETMPPPGRHPNRESSSNRDSARSRQTVKFADSTTTTIPRNSSFFQFGQTNKQSSRGSIFVGTDVDRVITAEDNIDPIDTIFSYLDPRESGALRTDDLDVVLDTIGEHEADNVLSNLSSQTNLQILSKEDLRELLFSKKERTFPQKLALMVLIWILPAFYAASTRLPFICLAVEVTDDRGGELWQVSVLLGAYQTSRALANFIISMFGGPDPMQRLHIPMILTGLVGWLIAGRPQFTSVWALFALCGVGLSESVVNLQTSAIHETSAESPSNVADPMVLADRIRVQYAAVAGGVFICWLIGGWLFTNYGFTEISYLGIACHCVQFVGTIFFQRFSASSALKKERQHSSHRDAELLPNRHTDGRVFLRSITYRIKAMAILAKEATAVFEGVPTSTPDVGGSFDQAAILAQEDVVLMGSLKLLYRAFFNRPKTSNKRPSLMVRSSGTGKKSNKRQSLIDSAGAITSMLRNLEDIDMGMDGSIKNPDVTMVDCAEIAVQLMDLDGDGQVTEREFVAYLAPRVYSAVFEVGSNDRKQVDIIWPYMKAVVFTQAVMAFCIGCFLSTALLMYTERFGVTPATVGLLMAIGEGLGAFNIFAFSAIRQYTARKKAERLYEEEEKPTVFAAMINRPLHLPFVLFIVGCSTMGFTSKVFGVAVMFQMIMSAMNDPSVSFLNELIATSIPSSKFRKYQGMGQWLRRLGNVVTGVLGPFLFGIYEDLPFLLFGGIVALWGFVLWYLLYRHAAKVDADNPDVNKEERSKSVVMEPFNPFLETSRVPWHVIEQQYFCRNREEINEQLAPGRSQALNLAVLDCRMRRIGAYQRMLEVELKHEKKAREDVEERLELIERKESAKVVHEISSLTGSRHKDVPASISDRRTTGILRGLLMDDSASDISTLEGLGRSRISSMDMPTMDEAPQLEPMPVETFVNEHMSSQLEKVPLTSTRYSPAPPTPSEEEKIHLRSDFARGVLRGPQRTVTQPQDTDVLCGRGEAALGGHPGNQTYRLLVNLNKRLYATCLTQEKTKISRSIVAAIREQNGRFLEFDPEAGSWRDIGEARALEKTSEALKNGQVDLRRK